GTRYTSSMAMLRQRIDNPDLTPSAQVLESARGHGGFFKYTMFASQQHKQSLLAQPLGAEMQARFENSAAESLVLQARIEAAGQGNFEDYVARYYA
ncbi:MAG: glutamate--cysteine ligase, partial [Rhodoferax sp.]|nr:glutamate--cysteine ligase [Rhodoferax sp.]